MNLAVLYSGGKDSTYAALLVKKEGYNLSCLISIVSKNPDSFMFHTPSITRTIAQAQRMNIPLITQGTQGNKEEELQDLEQALRRAQQEYHITGVVTGAVESVYQAVRIQRLCKKLNLECFNPLWQKNQIELLEELLANNFEIIIVSVAAYPLNQSHLGRTIDKQFIKEMKAYQEEHGINPAGEGGEYESFVLNCPLFTKKLTITKHHDIGEGWNYRREVEVI